MPKHKKKHHNKSSPGTAAVNSALSSQATDTPVNAPASKESVPPTSLPPETFLSSRTPPEKKITVSKDQVLTRKASPEVIMAPVDQKNSDTDGIISVPNLTPVLTAVGELLDVIKNYNGSTVNGLMEELNSANKSKGKEREEKMHRKCILAVNSACAQLIRYTTLTLSLMEAEDVSKCKEQMLNEGLKYLRTCERSISKVSRWAVTLIFDGARILVHSDSLVVLETLRSVPKNIYFSVYIVIDNDRVSEYFKGNYNIEVKTIRDAEVGTLMEEMDLVMVGAEAVLKNGGIINKVGTLPLAICAREMNKPLYVLAESFKFSLMYPMNQMDLPKDVRYESSAGNRIRVDYTLPKYITFLVTDRGLLTPTAICDELIELYT